MTSFEELFNPEFLKPTVLEFEILVNFEAVYRQLERLYASNGLEMPFEFEQFREKMHLLWEDKQKIPTDVLIARVQKGNEWLKKNEYNMNRRYAENMMLYASLLQELKYRGVSEHQAIKTTLVMVNPEMLKITFGDLVEEFRGGDE